MRRPERVKTRPPSHVRRESGCPRIRDISLRRGKCPVWANNGRRSLRESVPSGARRIVVYRHSGVCRAGPDTARDVRKQSISEEDTMLKRLFSPITITNALVLAFLAPGAGPTTAAQLAAGVEYSYVDRSGGLPDDYRAPTGTSLKFLSIKTIDGSPVQAALWQPDTKLAAHTTLIVMVHGSGG